MMAYKGIVIFSTITVVVYTLKGVFNNILCAKVNFTFFTPCLTISPSIMNIVVVGSWIFPSVISLLLYMHYLCWLNHFYVSLQNSNVENLPPHVLRLVYKEVSALAADPPEGIKIYPSEEDITELHTAIEGPGKVCTETGPLLYIWFSRFWSLSSVFFTLHFILGWTWPWGSILHKISLSIKLRPCLNYGKVNTNMWSIK